MVSVLAALAIGASLFALVRGLSLAATSEHRQSRARLDEIGGDAPARTRSRERRRSRRRRSAVADPEAESTAARTRQWLRRGGLAWEPADLAGVMLAAGVVPATVVAVATSGNTPASLAVGVVTMWLPVIVVHRRVARRRVALNAQVVETLEVVASSLRSGFGFTQALDLAAREQPDPIRGELLQTMREVSLGASTDEALERLVVRTGDEDLALAINAVVIQRRIGGDLSEILGNIAGMIRERVRIRGEIQTITAQARMSAWIVGLLPICLAVVLTAMQPDQMRVLIDDPAGRMLVGVGLCLQVVGFLAVRKIAAIEY